MILKKHPKADLERKRFAFFQIGLILAGSFCLAAFEYKSLSFSDIEKDAAKEEMFTSKAEIPKEIIYTSKPQKKQKIQLRQDEVKVVDKLPPIVNKTIDQLDIIDIDLNAISKALKGDETGFTFNPPKFGPLMFAEKMPLFPGGEVAMAKWIAKNINVPDYAYNAEGIVYVRFIVNKNGQITNVSLSQGIEPDHDLAALAVVKKMPRWSPGEQAGKPVDVQYDLPIRFKNR